jgi:hypothetical protein
MSLNNQHLTLPSHLPDGTQLQQVRFSSPASPPSTTAKGSSIADYRDPGCSLATLEFSTTSSADGYPILCIPHIEIDASPLIPTIADWVEPGVALELRQSQTLMLQGVQIIWGPARAAILAPPERWETLRYALAEFTFFDRELRQIEQGLGKQWTTLQNDAPLAFEVREPELARAEQLKARFLQVFAWRASLAQLEPHLHRPPVHPPTLASQVGERLRERTRIIERAEFIDSQLDVIERMHDLCSQRMSDFSSSRKHLILEWIIIILLAIETAILLVDYLTPETTNATNNSSMNTTETKQGRRRELKAESIELGDESKLQNQK